MGTLARSSPFVLVAMLAIGLSLCASTSLSIDPPPERIGASDSLVSLPFRIHNLTSSDASVRLECSLPSSWTALPLFTPMLIPAGGDDLAFVTVFIPQQPRPGTYTIQLSATLIGPPHDEVSASAVVTLPVAAGVHLESGLETHGFPGVRSEHCLLIHNTGNIADTFLIDVSLNRGWEMRTAQETVSVLPGDHASFAFEVAVPSDALPGTTFLATVTATSTVDPDVSASVRIASSVAPPPPTQVQTRYYAVLPTTFTMSVDEAGNPQFSLSLQGEVPGAAIVGARRYLGLDGLSIPTFAYTTDQMDLQYGSLDLSGSFLQYQAIGTSVGAQAAGGSLYGLFAEGSKALELVQRCDLGEIRLLAMSTGDASSRTGQSELQVSGQTGSSSSACAIFSQFTTQTSSGRACQMSASITASPMLFSLVYQHVDPGFLPSTERETWDLSLRVVESPCAFEFGANAGWGTIVSQSVVPAVSIDHRSWGTRIAVPTTADGSIRWTCDRARRISQDSPRTTDESQFGTELAVQRKTDLSTGSLVFSIDRSWDFATSADFAHLACSISATRPIGTLETGIQLHTGGVYDFHTSTWSSSPAALRLECSLPQAPFAPCIAVSFQEGELDLNAAIEFDALDSDWSGSAQLRTSIGSSCTFSADFALTFPHLFTLLGPSYGTIRGVVFVDADEDGIRDIEEEGLADVLLTAGQVEAITGENGCFAFGTLLPGTYPVSVSRIPIGYRVGHWSSATLQVTAGAAVEIEVPAVSRSLITGAVYLDGSRNGVRDAGEAGVANARITVSGDHGTLTVRTDSSGRYTVEVVPGSYELRLHTDSLPPRCEPTTATSQTVDIDVAETAWALFGVFQAPQQILYTTEIPEARFAVSPDPPRVFSELTLNASESEPTDEASPIIDYRWELRRGSSEIVLTGPSITVILEESGMWLIRLTVTDTGGRTATVQQIVNVL